MGPKTDFSETLATCRYSECQRLHKERHSTLKWKPTICKEDLDFSGYYTLTCTKKCHVDFHPWCWKNKKGKKLDKDYLQERCFTPDCGAPVSEITIFRNDKEPVKIKDEKITKRMINNGGKSA